MPGSNEFFVMVDGKKEDAGLHAELLDNEEAERAIAAMAIERAIKDGLSREEAEQLYRYRGTTG
jgi:hypothetical protein